MQFLSYFHDPDDLFVDLIKDTKFPSELNNSLIAVSPVTTDKIKDLLIEAGFVLIEGGLYGEARICVIKEGLETRSDNTYFLCDFDKLLHWLTTAPEEFVSVFSSTIMQDYVAIARSSKALATYPETWVQTEDLATRLLAKIVKDKLDYMNGPVILSDAAAKVIADQAQETGTGSCAEFCLLTFLAGLSLGEIEVDGLTWEDPDRYPGLINKYSTYDEWKYETYHSLYEWRKRVEFLHEQVKVMIRLTEEPTNPKYPVVHNKIFER